MGKGILERGRGVTEKEGDLERGEGLKGLRAV